MKCPYADSEKQRPGFTLIELTITLAIAMVLVIIAVPRYNSLLLQQEFLSDVQKIATCIQQAQTMASAPTANLLNPDVNGNSLSARWTAASLSSNAGGIASTCSDIASDASTSFSSLNLSSPSDQLAVAQTMTGISTVSVPSFRVYFGVIEKGVPVAFFGDGLPTQTNGSGGGVPISIVVKSESDSSLTAHIIIEQAGAPVHVITP